MATPELKARISLDGSRWRAGLKDAERQADRWGTGVAKTVQGHLLAAFSLTALLKVATASIDQFTQSVGKAGELMKQARRADIGGLFEGDETEKLARSIELIQQMSFALERVGIQGDRVDDIFQDFSTRRVEALEGLENKDKFGNVRENDQLRAFRKLGISTEDLQNKSSPELLFQLSDKLKGTKETDDIKEAMDALFSDAGVDFLVLMREGLKEQMQIARNEGLVVTGEDIIARDQTRKAQLIKQRRAEIKKNQANSSGEFFSDLYSDVKVGFFDSIGTPGDMAMGTGANLLERFGIAAEKIESATSQQLRETLEQKRLLREIVDATNETSVNTKGLTE